MLTIAKGYLVSVPMTYTEICELYDLHPDMTLTELSQITGKTIAELKRILMGEAVQ